MRARAIYRFPASPAKVDRAPPPPRGGAGRAGRRQRFYRRGGHSERVTGEAGGVPEDREGLVQAQDERPGDLRAEAPGLQGVPEQARGRDKPGGGGRRAQEEEGTRDKGSVGAPRVQGAPGEREAREAHGGPGAREPEGEGDQGRRGRPGDTRDPPRWTRRSRATPS